MNAPAKLRFVAICDADAQSMPKWQAECLRAAQACGEAEIVALIPAASGNSGETSKSVERSWRRRMRGRITELVPEITARDWAEFPRWLASDERIATTCDFVLVFQPRHSLSQIPRLGVWHLRIGGLDPHGDEPLAWREMVHRVPAIAAEWVAVGGYMGAGRVIQRAVLPPRSCPWTTADALLNYGPVLLVGAIRRARRGSIQAAALPPSEISPPLPGLAHIWLSWARYIARRMLIRSFRKEIWTIGILAIEVDKILAGASLPMPLWLDQPRSGSFHADPFPILFEGRPYLMFEKWCETESRGHIAVAALDSPAGLADARRVIDLGCHMSYPFTFEYDGAVWCTPEVSEKGGLQILKMGDTPLEWLPVRHELGDLPIVDPTLFEYEGRWWLFAGLRNQGREQELHAWYAVSPLHSWTPHPLNPIKIDCGSARPAGALFRSAGGLYRPGQDCSDTYGKAVILHRIVRLDPEGFEEVEVARIEAGRNWPYRDGVHTLNVSRGCVILDAKRHVISLRSPIAAVQNKLRWRRYDGIAQSPRSQSADGVYE